MPSPVGSPIDLDPANTYFDSVADDTFKVIQNNTVILHDLGKLEGEIFIDYSSNPAKKVGAPRMAEKIAAGTISLVETPKSTKSQRNQQIQSEDEISNIARKVSE